MVRNFTAFNRAIIKRGDTRVMGYRITCSEPGCVSDYFVTKKSKRDMPDEAIANIFRHRGWQVGKNAKKNTCQDCAAKKQHPKETTMTDQTTPAVSAAAPASPVRQLGRDDRRVIFAKLEEVYLDETKGYSPGWHDQRVADDLNCPLKWVETVRDENFGPNKTDLGEKARALNATLEKVEASIKDASEKQDKLATQIRMLGDQIAGLSRTIDYAHREADECRRTLRKLSGTGE